MYPHTPTLPVTLYMLEKFLYTRYLITFHENFKNILVMRFYELLPHIIYYNIL